MGRSRSPQLGHTSVPLRRDSTTQKPIWNLIAAVLTFAVHRNSPSRTLRQLKNRRTRDMSQTTFEIPFDDRPEGQSEPQRQVETTGAEPRALDMRTAPSRESLRELFAKHHLMPPLEVDRLCEAEHSSRSGVVAGLIAHSSVAVLCGDSGLGKSPLAYQLGLSVAADVPFVEMKTDPGLVVYAHFENSLEQTQD